MRFEGIRFSAAQAERRVPFPFVREPRGLGELDVAEPARE
jgi:hypothetical protein